VLRLTVVLVDMRVLSKDVVLHATTQPTPTNQTHPQTLALVTLLTEGYDRRLLVVPAQGTSIELPPFQTLTVEVVPAKDRYDLP
jgi:hypothetical protein